MTIASVCSSASNRGISSAYEEPMIASPPIETAVDWPRPAAVSVDDISVVMPPERLMTPIRPGAYALPAARPGRVPRAGPPPPPADPAHLHDVRDDDPEAVGADDPRAAQRRELDHLGDVAARDALGDDDDELDVALDRLEDRVAAEGRRDGDDGAVDRRLVVGDGLLDGVEDRHAVDVAPAAAGGDAADDPRAGAVLEALAREVHRLAAGDALDDKRRRLVDEDRHQPATPWIFSTARRAASCIETLRSAYSTP